MALNRLQDKVSPKSQLDTIVSQAPAKKQLMWESLLAIVNFLGTSQGAWTVVILLLAIIAFYVLYH